MGNPRRKRTQITTQCAGGEEEVDRLSNLPDEIIHHILSFLDDTPSAVKTCVLSKRWKHLWTSIPDLSFHHVNWAFLIHTFLRRDPNTKLHSLRLYICSDYALYSGVDGVALRNWAVDNAVRYGVRHIDLYHRDYIDRCPVPSALLGCRTLKTLTLRHLDVSDLLLSSSCFGGVTDLCLEDCVFNGCFCVSGIFPNVVNLRLLHLEVVNGVMEVSGTLQLVYLDMVGLVCDKVKLSAPNLRGFRYSDNGSVINDFFDIDLPSLRRAEVLLYEDGKADRVFKLLYGIRSVESLAISIGTLEALDKARLLKHQTSSFSKLTFLKLLVSPNKCRRVVRKEIKAYLLSGTPRSQRVDVVVDRLPYYPAED
ncbi:hypothetical protein Tsubulata_017538 [Turnera subulata]|uniref:F-box domain-containing protein n=1 Tax=Turnera subulata TaxID=218843 RepID=A0A9Q0J5Q2_9ROSI|nr:hypothetical protein Tsubulata_017538 [Turnera subulata]